MTSLFQERLSFTTSVDLYRGVLLLFQPYVKKYQAEKPLAHELHADMYDLVARTLALFMPVDAIPETPKGLSKLDVKDSKNHLNNQSLGVGEFAYLAIRKACRAKDCVWVKDLLQRLKDGLVRCAEMLITRLPICNTTIIRLSSLDPTAVKEATTISNFKKLAEHLPSVVPEEELGKLDNGAKGFHN